MKRALRAVIFDMDGVLTDTEPAHFAATNAVLAELNHKPLTWDQYAPYIGTSESTFWHFLEEDIGLKENVKRFVQRYGEEVLRLLGEKVEALPGARKAIEATREAGLKTALASSSRAEWVAATLHGADLQGLFEVVISGEMVEHGKPAPDIFLLAAQQLGVLPEACLVLEDSPRGIEAAKAAGMLAIGVRSAYEMDLSQADDVIENIAVFSPDQYMAQSPR
jgi:HAD superfamily hydrolase (TIGR01509 family)